MSNETTWTTQVVVPHPHGLHARPATLLAILAQGFDAELYLSSDRRRANMRSILELLGLGATAGTRLTVSALGRDAKPAIEAVASLFCDGFDGGATPADSAARPSRAVERAPQDAPTRNRPRRTTWNHATRLV